MSIFYIFKYSFPKPYQGANPDMANPVVQYQVFVLPNQVLRLIKFNLIRQDETLVYVFCFLTTY